MVGELKKYSCDRCGNSFKTNYKRSLLRHIKNIHEGDVKKVMLKEEKRVRGGTHKCQEIAWCTYVTTDLRNLSRHIQTKHRYKRLKKCLYCNYQTTSTEKLKSHKKEHKDEVLARHNCSVCNLAFMNSESFENQMSRPFEVFWRIIPTCFEWWIESLMKLLLILEIIDIKYKK